MYLLFIVIQLLLLFVDGRKQNEGGNIARDRGWALRLNVGLPVARFEVHTRYNDHWLAFCWVKHYVFDMISIHLGLTVSSYASLLVFIVRPFRRSLLQDTSVHLDEIMLLLKFCVQT